MQKRLLVILVFFLVLLSLGSLSILKSARGFLEKSIVLFVYRPVKNPNALESLKIQGLEEELAKAKEQNQVFREQLGAIPERSNLRPAELIWETETELILKYPYPVDKDLLSHPVVFGETYLGRIKRLGTRLIVVEKPQSSGFIAKGETGARVKGRLLGQFNEQVVFETPVNAPLNKGDKVYILDEVHAWRFLVGRVSEINKNARLPTKQGIINFLPADAPLSTVFVVE